MTSDETIVAVSSAVGSAARMIVRTSGPRAIELLVVMAPDAADAAGGSASRRLLRFADLACPAWVYVFRGPRSYTGEDLVEYHLPGSPVLIEWFVCTLTRADGVRPAEPGEFTARAYFNGRIDLTQAEGVAAVVSAQSQLQADAGRRLMAGDLARRVKEPADLVLATLALLEVGIDFSDEDVTFLPKDALLERLSACRGMLDALLADTVRFKPLGHEPTVVLVGRPNAGKSTLMNRLAGYERAVASATPGTTRDALTERVRLRRGTIRLIDVAGLEDEGVSERFEELNAASDTDDPEDSAVDTIARQMSSRARREIERADLVVRVTAVDDARSPLDAGREPDLSILSKADLSVSSADGQKRDLEISAHTGNGIDRLIDALDTLAFGREGGQLSLNTRHESAVTRAGDALERALALAVADGPVELIAAELREVIADLGAILGEVTPDDLLSEIFARFCIGK